MTAVADGADVVTAWSWYRMFTGETESPGDISANAPLRLIGGPVDGIRVDSSASAIEFDDAPEAVKVLYRYAVLIHAPKGAAEGPICLERVLITDEARAERVS